MWFQARQATDANEAGFSEPTSSFCRVRASLIALALLCAFAPANIFPNAGTERWPFQENLHASEDGSAALHPSFLAVECFEIEDNLSEETERTLHSVRVGEISESTAGALQSGAKVSAWQGHSTLDLLSARSPQGPPGSLHALNG